MKKIKLKFDKIFTDQTKTSLKSNALISCPKHQLTNWLNTPKWSLQPKNKTGSKTSFKTNP